MRSFFFGSVWAAAFVFAFVAGCGGDSTHSSTSTGGATSSGGAASGTVGSEGKPCYPNGTCNGTLSCLSKLCVNAAGTGGAPATGGRSSAEAGADSGGIANGGTTVMSTGGSATASTGGKATASTGGQTTASTGGTTSTGGTMNTGGTTIPGGTAGTGGTSGGGGSSGVCYPVDPSQHDATFTACASGQGCYPTPTGDSHCAGPTTASGLEGVDCFALAGQPDNTKCAPGYFCGSDTLKCQKYCRVAMPFCPNSETCEIFPSRAMLAGPEEIGFCQ